MLLSSGPFTADDLSAFMDLAQAEGWICDQWEFAFLLREAATTCRVCRDKQSPRAFITGIRYDQDAWIGNLLVHPGFRRKGLGRRLMVEIIADLDSTKATRIWLTASAQGAALYGELGFSTVDRIERWVRTGSGTQDASPPAVDFELVRTLDAAAWGSPRTALLREKCNLAQTWTDGNGYMVRHETESGIQIGPWCGDNASAEALLPLAMAGTAAKRIFLDVPAANTVASQLLHSAGFNRQGETLLMCRGKTLDYKSSSIFALGSMGSIG